MRRPTDRQQLAVALSPLDIVSDLPKARHIDPCEQIGGIKVDIPVTLGTAMETEATILHADLDAFHASVEQLLDARLPDAHAGRSWLHPLHESARSRMRDRPFRALPRLSRDEGGDAPRASGGGFGKRSAARTAENC